MHLFPILRGGGLYILPFIVKYLLYLKYLKYFTLCSPEDLQLKE